MVVRTGRHTGRSPQDRYIVDEPGSHDGVWWGGFNQPISPRALRGRACAHDRRTSSERDVFVAGRLCRCAPGLASLAARLHRDRLGQHLLRQHVPPTPSRRSWSPSCPISPIIDAPSFKADPERDGVRSETVVLVHLSRQEILIGGTEYAGEIKKGAFGIMNYRLPDEGVLPMHSSVNIGANGDVAIFFGLSGTGKTTLSADPERTLIGDDEHGWGPTWRLQLRGWLLRQDHPLSHVYEPDIYSTTRTFGTILENVEYDPITRELDLDSDRITENTRAAFPLHFISNSSPRWSGWPSVQHHLPDGRRVRRPAADLPTRSRPGHVPLHQRLHRPPGGDRSRRPASRRRPSPPVSGHPSCRAIRARTPTCSVSGSIATTCPYGSSTPAGQVDRMASVSASTSRTRATWFALPSDGQLDGGAHAT